MYLHHLPGYPELEQAFKLAGYTIEVDLSNSLCIANDKEGGEWVEYDELPENLRGMLDQFAQNNNLEE
ncbi:MAG TPA: hypothetical protein PLN38_17740 [Chitinophagales bacterium]|nr:hypothetical protein [Chitinophagales bacterium]